MRLFNQIQRGALQERLTRGLGINERSPAPTLASDVQPVVLLEDLTKQNPWQQPTERRWSSAFNVPAVVGELGIVTVSSPVGGRSIFVIDRISLVSAVAITVQWGWTPADEVAAEFARYADVRNAPDPLNNRAGPLIRRGSDAVSPIDGVLGIVRISTTLVYQRLYGIDVVLSPRQTALSNDALAIVAQTVNTTFDISIDGREYLGP